MKASPLPAQDRHDPAGKPVPHHAPKPARGNMKPGEIKPLIMAARKAYDFQDKLGNIDPGDSFDAWRHRECMTAVHRPGITCCHHEDFRPLLSHFQHLAGDDDSAFKNSMQGGRPTDHASPGDTHEARRHLVHGIATTLAAHHHLATTPVDQLLAECVQVYAATQPDVPWEHGNGPAAYRALLDRRAAIEAKGKGPISVGYVVYLVRQKTRRPDLVLGQDWQAGLAESCTAVQLLQIHYTITNRIAAVEGVGSPSGRNKTQRSPKAQAARDPKQIPTRW